MAANGKALGAAHSEGMKISKKTMLIMKTMVKRHSKKKMPRKSNSQKNKKRLTKRNEEERA